MGGTRDGGRRSAVAHAAASAALQGRAGGPSGPLRQAAAAASAPGERPLREQWVDWAMRTCRITSREAWASAYDRDPVGTAATLRSLPEGHAVAQSAAPATAAAVDRWKAGEINIATGQPASLSAGVPVSADERSVLPRPVSLLGREA